MAIVIVEGIDGAGKTTLIKLIEKHIPKKFNKHFHHCGPLTSPVEVEYYDPISRVRPDTFFVSDRWHVGEMIYGPIYRNESKVEGKWKDAIEDLLDRRGAVKVVMKPSLEVVKSRLSSRGEDYLQDEHIDEVYEFYSKYAAENDYYVIEETDLQKIEDTAEEIVDMAIRSFK